MVRFTPLLLACLSATALAATSCSSSSQCPEDKPCCSQYGECGTGAYCLGGCDPLSSFSLDSCAPEPVCVNKKYTWDNLDSAALNTKYLGNASESDWVYSGFPEVKDGNLAIKMPKETVGTLFANTHYIWYGKIGAKIRSSRGAGVVTAFILLSDVKDEIDFEFVGYDLDNVQTNYYFQGILDYNNGGKSSVDGGTYDEWHDYEIDWTPDQITWSVDGKSIRTLEKEKTWNETASRYEFPQSPSRMQLSLWPAGGSSSAPGTIEWAGGKIDWDSEDIKKNKAYIAEFGEITVECYDPPKGADIQGDKAYIFTSDSGTNNSIRMTDNSTVLGSMGATGLDMDLGADDDKSDSTSSSTSSSSDSVPTNQGGGSGSQGGGSSSTSSSTSSQSTGFESGTTDSAAPSQNEHALRGSLFSVLVAVVALINL